MFLHLKRFLSVFLFLSASLLAQVNSARMLSGVNTITATTYTFVALDATRLTNFSNGSSVAATLANPLTPFFGAGNLFSVINTGAGSVTITCTSCTINGTSTLVLTTSQGADIYSDGTNYWANLGSGTGGGGGGGGGGWTALVPAQYATVALAIAALPTTGGTIYVEASASEQACPTSIPSNTAIVSLGPSADRQFIGSLTSAVVTDTQVLFGPCGAISIPNGAQNIRLQGISLDFNFSGNGLAFVSASGIQAENLSLINCGNALTPCLSLTTGTATSATFNSLQNHFSHISINCNESGTSSCKAGIYLAGSGAVAPSGGGSAVTNNDFTDINITGELYCGIDLEKNTDSNHFFGGFINPDTLTSDSADFCFNLNNPSTDQDANANDFHSWSLTGNTSSVWRVGQSSGHVFYGLNAPPPPANFVSIGGIAVSEWPAVITETLGPEGAPQIQFPVFTVAAYEDYIGGAILPTSPVSGNCRAQFNTTSGSMYWINSAGAWCGTTPTPAIKTSWFIPPQGTNTDGCAAIGAAEALSISNGFGQDVNIDLTGTWACANLANVSISGFTGNVDIYNGVLFKVSGGSAVLQPKTILRGSGEGTTVSSTLGTYFQACNNDLTAACGSNGSTPVSYPVDTPMFCFTSCSTSAATQGFDTQLWWMTADCNYIAGCVTYQNFYCQENCGLHYVYGVNWANNGRGIYLDKPSGNPFRPKNSDYDHVVLGNTNSGANGPCQEGATAIFVNGQGSGAEFPKDFSIFTLSENQCDNLNTSNSWPAWPLDDVEIVNGAKAHFHDFHNEFSGRSHFLVGGGMLGYGAYFTATVAGGAITATTQIAGGFNYTAPVVHVYPVACTGGTLTPVVAGGVITSLTNSGSWSGCPTSTHVLISISDAITAGSVEDVHISDIYSCCTTTSNTTAMVQFASGATLRTVTIDNLVDIGASTITNLYIYPPGNNCARSSASTLGEFSIDDAGLVTRDDCHQNTVNQGATSFIGSGGIQFTPVAYSTLPTCNSGAKGEHDTISDSNTALWGAAAAGGGSTVAEVFCNGTNWIVIGATNSSVYLTDPGGNGIVKRTGPGTSAVATGLDLAAPLLCADSSGSSTAQVCNTTPTFTPASGSCVTYTTTTPAGVATTVNVNSLGAKPFHKWLGLVLSGGDIPANTRVQACYNGSAWDISTIGNAPAGGGPTTWPISFGSGQAVPVGGTEYVGLGIYGAETVAQVPLARAGTLLTLYCRGSGAGPTGSQTLTLTVNDNTSGTGLTCVLNSGSPNACSDLTHTATVSAGDLLDIQVVPANTPPSVVIQCQVLLQ